MIHNLERKCCIANDETYDKLVSLGLKNEEHPANKDSAKWYSIKGNQFFSWYADAKPQDNGYDYMELKDNEFHRILSHGLNEGMYVSFNEIGFKKIIEATESRLTLEDGSYIVDDFKELNIWKPKLGEWCWLLEYDVPIPLYIEEDYNNNLETEDVFGNTQFLMNKDETFINPNIVPMSKQEMKFLDKQRELKSKELQIEDSFNDL